MRINDHVLFDIRAILWLSEKPLTQRPEGLGELDHLFDGLISRHIANQTSASATSEKNIFGGKSFDRDLILIQLWDQDTNKMDQQIKGCLELVARKEEQAKVLLISPQARERRDGLAKKFPQVHFEII